MLGLCRSRLPAGWTSLIVPLAALFLQHGVVLRWSRRVPDVGIFELVVKPIETVRRCLVVSIILRMPLRRWVVLLCVTLVSKVILHFFWHGVVLERLQATEALDAWSLGLAGLMLLGELVDCILQIVNGVIEVIVIVVHMIVVLATRLASTFLRLLLRRWSSLSPLLGWQGSFTRCQHTFLSWNGVEAFIDHLIGVLKR